MIHYDLRCAEGHAFDGWFASSAAFDRLRAAGEVACPTCGSASVDRALMAPAVATRATAPGVAGEPELMAPVGTIPNVAFDNRAERMREALRAIRQAVIENGVDVGRRFAEEARRIHYGEAEPRGIYGQAEIEEARALIDEGIEILPLPVLPEHRN
jgi:hypothetical protein